MIENINSLYDVHSLSASIVETIARLLVSSQTTFTDTIYKNKEFSVISTIVITELPDHDVNTRKFTVNIRSVYHIFTEVLTSSENLIDLEILTIPVALVQRHHDVLYDYPADIIDTYSENILSMVRERFNSIL